jgi:indole-3-glycerol phosphate synthase
MASLVEVHDEDELPAAIASGARIIGVNNRDLRSFQVDLGVSLRLGDNIPSTVVKVAESGIHTPADIRRLQEVGFQAFLVGEHLMKSSDPEKALAALLS